MYQREVSILYGGYENLPDSSRIFIEKVCNVQDLAELYSEIRDSEKQNKSILVNFEKNYPNVLNQDNLAEILKLARDKKNAKETTDIQ